MTTPHVRLASPAIAVGRRLRAAREAASLSVEQVAASITAATGAGVSARTVARWESGEIDQPISRIYEYARAVGADVGSLMAGMRVRR